MNLDRISQTAMDLYVAYNNKAQIPFPSKLYPDFSIDEAYEVQKRLIREHLKAGRHLAGKKIGYTVRSRWETVGLNEPDYGYMFRECLFPSGITLSVHDFCQPMLEVEIAVFLRCDLSGSDLNRQYVGQAIEKVVAAFEIVDSRTEEGRTPLDVIADNATFGACIISSIAQFPTNIEHLYAENAKLYRHDKLVETMQFIQVMDGPVNSLLWLAQKLDTQKEPLRGGELILTGSPIQPIKIFPGDVFCAHFDTLGEIRITFTE